MAHFQIQPNETHGKTEDSFSNKGQAKSMREAVAARSKSSSF